MRWTRRLAGERSSWVVLRESTTLHREDIGTSIDWNSVAICRYSKDRNFLSNTFYLSGDRSRLSAWLKAPDFSETRCIETVE